MFPGIAVVACASRHNATARDKAERYELQR